MKTLEDTRKTEKHIQQKANGARALNVACGLELVFASSNEEFDSVLTTSSTSGPKKSTSGGGGPSRKSIFGEAKPVDTARREREIDEKLKYQINGGVKRNR